MGPLHGVRIVEFAGIGPAPFAAMMLADMGAEIVRVDRKIPVGDYAGQRWDVYNPGRHGVLNRGRRSVGIDLKQPEGADAALRLIQNADALIEAFRPGVMERLGLGPEPCLQRNPKLIYGRMTGWGQTGPLANAAGHDINYIALSGALHGIGPPDAPPVPPLNLVGDFGGGGMMLAYGMVCALFETRDSGQGQVIDAAMSDGAAALMAMAYGMHAAGAWHERGQNRIDGGAHFYTTYECADGKYLAVGANEEKFYDLLLSKCAITDSDFQDARMDPDRWPVLRNALAEIFRTKTRDAWCELLEGTDACVAPVLDLDEAPAHPHNQARGTFVDVEGVTQPAPVPRFSRTAAARPTAPPHAGEHSEAVLGDWGFKTEEIEHLRSAKVI